MLKIILSKTSCRVLTGSAAIFFALVCGPVGAHHSFNAQYDAEKPMTLTGEVTRVEWANPHIYYYVAVTEDDGEAIEWAVEIGAPNSMFRRGWRSDTLKPGDVVTVQGFLARDGSNQLNGRNTTLADGRELFSGSNDGAPEL